MPAIKTLKLLAHTDSYRPSSHSQPSYSLTRASSLNTHKDFHEKNLTHSKSLRILSSRTNDEQLNEKKVDQLEEQNDDNQQQQHTTDDADSEKKY